MARRRTHGFTLVELMIVVAMIGVLATLAIYGANRYINHSKTAEATTSLGALEVAEIAQFQRDSDAGGVGTGPYVHAFCPCEGNSFGSSNVANCLKTFEPGPPPSVAKGITPAAVWLRQEWACANFAIREPHYYAYHKASTGSGVGAHLYIDAYGDLNQDGAPAYYEIQDVGGANGDVQRVWFLVVNGDE